MVCMSSHVEMEAMVTKPRTQTERSKATINALQTAAIKLFGERGYDAAPLDEICAAADVTKGALYHHFPGGKIALFEAVVVLEHERMLAAMKAAPSTTTGELGLRQVLAVYFDVALEPRMFRITLLDAPAVLGLERWREIEYRYSMAFIREGLDAALQTNSSHDYREMFAAALFGAACELTLGIAASTNAESALNHAIDIMITLFAAAVRRSQGDP